MWSWFHKNYSQWCYCQSGCCDFSKVVFLGAGQIPGVWEVLSVWFNMCWDMLQHNPSFNVFECVFNVWENRQDNRVFGMNKWWNILCVCACMCASAIYLCLYTHTHKHRRGKQPLQFALCVSAVARLPVSIVRATGLCVCACVQDREKGVCPPSVLYGEHKNLITITETHTNICSYIVWEGMLRQLNNS